MIRGKDSCEWDGCEHPEAQYLIAVDFVRLDGSRSARSCRKHVALIAKALAEELGQWASEGVRLAELDQSVLVDEMGDRREARREQQEQQGA